MAFFKFRKNTLKNLMHSAGLDHQTGRMSLCRVQSERASLAHNSLPPAKSAMELLSGQQIRLVALVSFQL